MDNLLNRDRKIILQKVEFTFLQGRKNINKNKFLKSFIIINKKINTILILLA
jgi:hypothetical protein